MIRRLGRILLNSLTALSLLFLLATLALWIRSYWRSDTISFQMGRPILGLHSARGVLAFALSAETFYGDVITSRPIPPRERRFWSFDAGVGERSWGTVGGIGYVYLATSFALLPLVRALILATRRPAPDGRCPQCGYDLRATPDRCPECGHARYHPTQ